MPSSHSLRIGWNQRLSCRAAISTPRCRSRAAFGTPVFPPAQLSDDHLRAVRHEEGDAVALHDPARREPRGEAIAQPVQLPVRQPGTLEDRRRMAWSFGSGRLHDVHEGLLRVRRQGRRHPVVVVGKPGPLHEGFCRPRAESASRALVGNDLQVSEIPAGAVPHPQADQSLRAVAQLGDHQTGLFRVADEDAHFGTRDDHAHMEPSVGVRRGTHGLLEGSRPLGSQLLPCIGRMRYVLYGVAVPRRVFRAEVERTQVNRVVRRAIEPMKGDTDKALPLYVFASDVKLDGPVTELDPFEIRHALTGLLVEPNTLPGPIAQSTHAAVEDLDVVGLDGSLLSRDAGSSKQDDKSRHVHRRPLLLGSLVPQLLHIDTLATLHGRPNVYTGRRTWDVAVCPFPK